MSKYWKLIALVLIVFCSIALSYKHSTRLDEDDIDTVYIKKCAGCHGTDGVSNFPDAPDFTDPKFHKTHTDKELIKSVTDGKDPRMPAYGEILEKEVIVEIVAHIRKFAKKEGKSTSKKHQ